MLEKSETVTKKGTPITEVRHILPLRWAISCAIVALLLLLACATGCSAQKPDPERHFVFVCPIIDNSYWQQCIAGVEEADASLGVETEIVGPSTAVSFIDEMPSYMRHAIDSNPDGILVYAGVPEVADLIEVADQKGIPVVTVDADAPNTARAAYVGTDLYKMGFACGEELVSLTGGTANVGYVCTDRSIENEAHVYTAFKDAVCDYYVTIVAEAEGANSVEQAEECAKRLIAEHPEIDAFFVTGGENATGVAKALESLEKTDIAVIGLEDTEENLDYLRKGVIDALFVQDPYQMGYQGIRTLNKLINAEGSVKGSVSTDTVKITIDNIDTYKD